MASLWAYRREDWPGTRLWRRSNALFCCHRLPPTCDLGPIGPHKGWAEEAQGAPPRAPRRAVCEGGAGAAWRAGPVALAASTLREPVRSVFFAPRLVRLVAAPVRGDCRERELGHEELVLVAGEEAREAGVEGGAEEHRFSCCARCRYRRRANEANFLSLPVSTPEHHPVVLEPLLHAHDHGLVLHQQSQQSWSTLTLSVLEFPMVHRRSARQ